jgi:hypothetical protein
MVHPTRSKPVVGILSAKKPRRTNQRGLGMGECQAMAAASARALLNW